MKHSKVSDIISIKANTITMHAFPVFAFVGSHPKITRIKCYAIAQDKIKPFSIYPMKFTIESYEAEKNMLPLELVAVPQPDIKIEYNTITESEIYIISCDYACDISCHPGQVNIRAFVTALFPYVASKAFVIIEYEDE